MAVYLLHFLEPISDRHTTQHYLGFTNNLQQRIEMHRQGKGARLTEVAKERGIGFIVAREWWSGDRSLERQLKARKNGKKLCPFCTF